MRERRFGGARGQCRGARGEDRVYEARAGQRHQVFSRDAQLAAAPMTVRGAEWPRSARASASHSRKDASARWRGAQLRAGAGVGRSSPSSSHLPRSASLAPSASLARTSSDSLQVRPPCPRARRLSRARSTARLRLRALRQSRSPPPTRTRAQPRRFPGRPTLPRARRTPTRSRGRSSRRSGPTPSTKRCRTLRATPTPSTPRREGLPLPLLLPPPTAPSPPPRPAPPSAVERSAPSPRRALSRGQSAPRT